MNQATGKKRKTATSRKTREYKLYISFVFDYGGREPTTDLNSTYWFESSNDLAARKIAVRKIKPELIRRIQQLGQQFDHACALLFEVVVEESLITKERFAGHWPLDNAKEATIRWRL